MFQMSIDIIPFTNSASSQAHIVHTKPCTYSSGSPYLYPWNNEASLQWRCQLRPPRQWYGRHVPAALGCCSTADNHWTAPRIWTGGQECLSLGTERRSQFSSRYRSGQTWLHCPNFCDRWYHCRKLNKVRKHHSSVLILNEMYVSLPNCYLYLKKHNTFFSYVIVIFFSCRTYDVCMYAYMYIRMYV